MRLDPTSLPQFASEFDNKVRFVITQRGDLVRLEATLPTKVSSSRRFYSDRGPKVECLFTRGQASFRQHVCQIS